MRTTSFNLPDELITRLDAASKAEGRSRSNAAAYFLEAALNADAALRDQAQAHFQKLQTPGRDVFHRAAGGAADIGIVGAPPCGGQSRQLANSAESAGGLIPLGPPAKSFDETYEQGPNMSTENEAEHKRLQEQALRDAIAQDAAARRAAQESPLTRAQPRETDK